MKELLEWEFGQEWQERWDGWNGGHGALADVRNETCMVAAKQAAIQIRSR